MENKILGLFEKFSDKISFTYDEIKRMLDIKNSRNLDRFKRCLDRMVSKGKLYFDSKNNTYMLFENSNMYKGIFKSNDDCTCYVVCSDAKYIDNVNNLCCACDGDLVLVSYNTDNLCYEVVDILNNDKAKYVGVVFKIGDNFYLFNNKNDILRIVSSKVNLNEGDMVLFRKNGDHASVLEFICHKSDSNADILRIVYEHGFTNEFSDAVKREIVDIPLYLSDDIIKSELLNGRVDLRDKDIVTIDCDCTKDIDDAVYVEENSDGSITLYVCIADVSYYVKDGSALAARIKDVGTSVYPTGCVIPMLPVSLSNGICSLNPNVDRLAICFKSTFDSYGNFINFDVFKSIINSKKKMTYSDVDKILEDGSMVLGYEKFYKQLLMMEKLYLNIQKKFYLNGYLKFKNFELDILLDSDNKIESISRNVLGTGAKIIEFFMLITNKNACEYFSGKGVPLIYRVDDKPNFRKISDTIDMLQKKNYLDFSFRVFDKEEVAFYTKKEMQSILNNLGNVSMPEVFYHMLVEAMSRAQFSNKNIGHYPLGLTHYAQFTSPIRRGGDWRNHTIINYYLESRDVDATVKRFSLDLLFREALTYSSREREADVVENEVNRMLILEYLNDNVDKFNEMVLVGRVSFITDCIGVLLDNGISGRIEIPFNNYRLCNNNLYIGDEFVCGIGDLVSVKLVGVNLKKKEILFSLENNLEREYNLNGKKKSKEKIKIG